MMVPQRTITDIDLLFDVPMYDALKLLAKDATDPEVKAAAKLLRAKLVPNDSSASSVLAAIRPRVHFSTQISY
ncbi:hypothetical protein [Microvirga massiliensis]|uniref:hypothetical protein n=1 Tax=Microvirga massiliensis TaxID=1033741 RepID=UPI00062BEA7D|nr:hypothetical protein [Microvirga massiliensis]